MLSNQVCRAVTLIGIIGTAYNFSLGSLPPFVFGRWDASVSRSPSEASEVFESSREGSPNLPPHLSPHSEPACNDALYSETRYCILQALLGGNKTATEHLSVQAMNGHYLSACTAVKGAGDTIHEFVIRNHLAGVDHFYIYEDNADGENESVAQLLTQLSALITIIPFPSRDDFLDMIGRKGAYGIPAFKHPQHFLYWHCFLTYGNTTRWLLPIDADEFVEAKRPEDLDIPKMPFRLQPFMHVFLREIEESTPAQIARWTSVLTNNRVYPVFPDDRTTLAHKFPITCGRKDEFLNHTEPGVMFSAKVAAQPTYLNFGHYAKVGGFFVHGVKHWGPTPKELHFADPFKQYEVPVNSTDSQWTIVHYWSRSLADYNFKRRRGRLSGHKDRTLHELIRRERSCRRHGHLGISSSAVLRQELVSNLLQKVDSYASIQRKYYEIVSASLSSTAHFRTFIRNRGEKTQ